jgi:glycosyltransferase involved in cell wall biosynthesis
MKRLAVVFNNHSPYFRARLRAAGILLPLIAMPLHDEEGSQGDGKHEPYEMLPLIESGVPPRTGQILKAVQQALNNTQPDVVAVQGFSRRCALAALAWCAHHRKPAVVLGGFHALKRQQENLSNAIKQRLLRCCSAFLTAGRPHVEALVRWGVPPARIRTGSEVVDNAHFTQGAADARRSGSSYRKRLDLPQNYFLCVSRLAPEKNLLRLLEAFAAYRREAGKRAWKLVIVGDGPLHADLNIAMHQMELHQHALLAGTFTYRHLPAVYGLAQAFILASTREPWGLTVNEAMSAGLPVFVSDHCGCAPDLVRNGENGFVFDALAPQSLTPHLLRASRGEYDLSVMGRASLGLISEWTPEHFANRLRETVDLALASPAKPSRWDASLAGILARRPGAQA